MLKDQATKRRKEFIKAHQGTWLGLHCTDFTHVKYEETRMLLRLSLVRRLVAAIYDTFNGQYIVDFFFNFGVFFYSVNKSDVIRPRKKILLKKPVV